MSSRRPRRHRHHDTHTVNLVTVDVVGIHFFVTPSQSAVRFTHIPKLPRRSRIGY